MVKVKLENVTKIYGKKNRLFNAIDNVSFEIPSATFYGVLGASGAGKTTIMRMIAGLETPTEGTIYFDNEIVAQNNKDLVPVESRNVGMVFQNWALYPHLSNFENIAFPLKVLRWSSEAIKSRINELCETLGISEVIHKKPGQVSGGQQQRVAVARALAKNPSLLLLDEPFSNLDANSKDDARTLVRQVQESLGVSAVIVSHDPSDIFSLAKEVAVIAKGKLGQIATPTVLYDFPKNTNVAGTLGEINFMGAKIKRKDKAKILSIFDKIELNGLPYSLEFIPEGEITLGIRPEELHIEKEGTNEEIDNHFLFLGNFQVSSSNYSQGNFLTSVRDVESKIKINAINDSPLNPESKVNLYVNARKIKFFNKETGELMSHDLEDSQE
jgi:glucose/arabinose transport system ATP-binding protein